MTSYSAIITSAEVIIEGGQIFKMAASRFVDLSEEEINLVKENAILCSFRSSEGLVLLFCP